MIKKTYVSPDSDLISLDGENSLMASSPQDYNSSDYDWSGDGYIF